MAEQDLLPLWLRATLRAYPWRRIDPVPCAPLRRPVARARVALITTAGLVPEGEAPFDAAARGGDVTYRVIAGDARVQALTR